MRLQAIKLAGFKSFVDPTTVPFPSNLCAVVGPNGCGKSNIIDAVKWVMGESSAKTLRGETMSDVIFNGSTGRKPVGQASIELLFDNAEGRLTGEYAAYNEISIKRQVSRDGQSNYYLNNQKCRRKDITDIFLGTGLGPRSYSIIEQGMISDLVEAKPDELRGFLEEAAAISKYKERRRETERRISHTRDNMERLHDIREELERQLAHLERQAKSAEKYKALRTEEQQLKAESLGLQWQRLTEDINVQDKQITRLEVEQDAQTAEQRRIDADIETKRAQLVELADELNAAQKRFYDQGAEITRIENQIRFQKEKSQQQDIELTQVKETWQRLRTDLDTDEQKLLSLDAELAEVTPRQAAMQQLEQAADDQLVTIEQAMQSWQERWDGCNNAAAESRQHVEVQQSSIEHLEESIRRLNERVEGFRTQVAALSEDRAQEEVAPLHVMLGVQETQLERITKELTALTSSIEQQREQNIQLTTRLDKKRSELQSAKGRHAALVTLQQAALGQQDDVEVHWLERQGMGDKSRLAEKIRVEDGWQLAVEIILGDRLQAVCIDELDALSGLLGDFEEGHLHFVAGGMTGAMSAAVDSPVVHTRVNASSTNTSVDSPPTDLLFKKVHSDASLTPLLQEVLQKVHIADSLPQAMALRAGLNSGASVVTRDGIWMGANWLKVTRDKDLSTGVLKRQEELDGLVAQIAALEQEVQDLTSDQDRGQAALTQAEADRDALQLRSSTQQTTMSDTQAQLGAKQVQAEQIQNDLERINGEIQEGSADLAADEQALSSSRRDLATALDKREADILQREALAIERAAISAQLDEARTQAKAHKARAHELALHIQALNSNITSTQQAMARLEEQETPLLSRQENLEAGIKDSEAPQTQLQAELATHLEQRLEVENELAGLRHKTEGVEQQVKEREQALVGVMQQIDGIRERMEAVRLARQEIEVRRTTVEERLSEFSAEKGKREAGALEEGTLEAGALEEGTIEESAMQSLLASLPEAAEEADWEDKLTRIGKRIQRLGAINLAAIDEFDAQSERKQYLDAQNEDLEKALATLEQAIRKIDIETRTRFKETFDKVNTKLQQIFPKLFGGGHAYLEMTGEDLLNTGVSIMARPPGKKNSNIHLLSGGEKALTAIALVFSIFSLNPAPFCFLDEVDASLDDANLIRYAALVKEMSRTVQFIFITHSKISMETGEQLMGVTMHEPGVSRLVSVDVEEAVAMVAV